MNKHDESIARRAVNLAVLVERERNAARIRELEDALIAEVHCRRIHLSGSCTPTPMDDLWTWGRDPDCSACQRLERLLGHRRPKVEA